MADAFLYMRFHSPWTTANCVVDEQRDLGRVLHDRDETPKNQNSNIVSPIPEYHTQDIGLNLVFPILRLRFKKVVLLKCEPLSQTLRESLDVRTKHGFD